MRTYCSICPANLPVTLPAPARTSPCCHAFCCVPASQLSADSSPAVISTKPAAHSTCRRCGRACLTATSGRCHARHAQPLSRMLTAGVRLTHHHHPPHPTTTTTRAGWNACSSCHSNGSKVRQYMVLPGMKSGRIYSEWPARASACPHARMPACLPACSTLHTALLTSAELPHVATAACHSVSLPCVAQQPAMCSPAACHV